MRVAFSATVILGAVLGLLAQDRLALQEGGIVGPDGVVAACAIPQEFRKRNVGSPPPRYARDPRSLGCCVFRALELSADYQNVPQLNDFAEWMIQQGIPGGGHPAKVSDLIHRICQARGVAEPPYLQHTGGDLEFLAAAIHSGRPPCITYAGRDMHYGPNGRVAHMVNLIHLDPPGRTPRRAAIADNNFPGESQVVWMNADELRQRWLDMSGGWAIVLLDPPPPPAPFPAAPNP